MSAQPEAKQVPLVERLESVPVDARLAVDDGPYSTSFYAVGAMAHEAAAELRRLHDHTQMLDNAYRAACEVIRQQETVNAELLEALERIADPRNIHFAGDAQVVARAAIARAEGGPK